MVTNTYITYISNDRDIRAVLNLAFNLTKTKTKFPLQCICTENVSKEGTRILKERGIIIKHINLRTTLKHFSVQDNKIEYFINKHLFGKFYIFNIEGNHKFVYLDTDVLILQNIDHLFKQTTLNNIYMVPDMQASDDYSKIILIKNRFNSGVIVSENNSNIFNNLYKLLADNVDELINNPDVFVSDQFIFEKLIDNNSYNILRQDLSYNIHPILVESALSLNLIERPYIIHFMVKPKPWELMDITIQSHKFENETCKKYFIMWIQMYYELTMYLYFNKNMGKTNIKSYHIGEYNNENKLEYQLSPI